MILPETVLHDLRYAVRMLYRNAGSTVLTVIALALGIGVNTAVFTAYKAMVARPLAARNPHEMVNLALLHDSNSSTFNFSYPDYETFRGSVHSFSGLIAFRPGRVTLSNAGTMISQRDSIHSSGVGRLGLLPAGASNAEFASVFVVSENYFKVLGVTALHGRTFDPDNARDSAATPPVLISENYWMRRFAGDPAMLGKTIHLNGVAVAVTGILPHDFVGTSVFTPAFWLPLTIEPLLNGDNQWLGNRENERYRLFGRLAPGVGMEQAQAEMNSVAARVRALHDPHSEAARPALVLAWPGSPFPLPLNQYGALQLAILLIMLAAAMVLVVACANVGSLQLAKARSRQNELCTRLSLGASRLRIIRQLVTESALLGVFAGVLALLFTWAFLKVCVVQVANALPVEFGSLVFHVAPDLQIFAYAFAISLAAGVLSGLAPAMESSRSALTFAARTGTASKRSRWLQNALVAMQVALSLMLMIVGSMFIRGSIQSLKMATGYDTKHVLRLNFHFPESAKYTLERKSALVQDLRTRVAALPGVSAITSAQAPADFGFRTAAVSLDGENPARQSAELRLKYTFVEANYFQTLGIPLLLGRSFSLTNSLVERSLILSESAAKQLWPGENPLGRSLRLGPIDERNHPRNELVASGPAYQVIGVARDKRGADFDESQTKEIYLPVTESQFQSRALLIRTTFDATQLIKAIDVLEASIDPDMVATTATLESLLRSAPPFFISSLAAAVAITVGVFGLLLASMGIYGTVSFIVVLRTREVGIRMAIGAERRDVLALILRESARPVLIGLAVGLLLQVGVSYLLHGLFYGLSVVDGISFGGVSLMFLAVALVASYPPARRATRVDPMVALRYE